MEKEQLPDLLIMKIGALTSGCGEKTQNIPQIHSQRLTLSLAVGSTTKI
jgi:hypothetical protein